MLETVQWAEDYQIGVADIDKQHQYLFELVNNTLKEKELSAIKLALVKLYQYTREHFNAEERLMQKIAYPDYLEHKKAHDKLLEQLTEKSNALMEKTLQLEEFKQFLMDWLSKHILKADLNIGHFIKDNYITNY